MVLAILTLPLVTQSSQMTTLMIMQGMSKHKNLSLIYLVEALANLILSLILVRPMGMIGVALGTALTSTFSSLIAQPIYVCRVLSLGVFDYYSKAFLPGPAGDRALGGAHRLRSIRVGAAQVHYDGRILHRGRRGLFRLGVPDFLYQARTDTRAFCFVMQPDSFVCSHCLGHLTETPTALVCQGCTQAFPLWHGVPNFSATTDYYYGEFPQAMMRS